ncbi:MAG: hypothetical protein EAS52_03200 [Parapedobacter sp.]|nr:MAG: hypothetical protein EAS52_03200 [Parapedobacter sp.]
MKQMQTTPKLERFGIFCYKALVWLFLGVVIGSFVAEIQGFMPIWFIAVHVLGAIGLGWLFIALLFRYLDRKRARALAQDRAHASSHAAPARVDSIQFGGVRMMETRELTIIQVTVFPRSNAPYQTTVRQFMTAEDLDQLQEEALVTFCEDPHDHGYGTVLPTLPTEEIPAEIEAYQADTVYPERRNTGLWLLVGRNPSRIARSVSFILIFALFGIGFLSPYIVTGNLDWLWLRMKYFPQKLIFQDKGNFNPEAFNKAYDKAVAYIGDRRIESLLFYKDFTAVKVEHTDKAGHLRSATIRGNSVEAYFIPSSPDDHDRLFTVESVRFDILKKALDDAAKDYDIEDIMYIGFRKDIRWSMPGPRRERHVDVHIVFEGGETSLDYNGATGERLLPM